MPGDEARLQGADRQYECPVCGHVNPGDNQFCGMCGAASDEVLTAPALRVTGARLVTASDSSSGVGVQHHHHHYRHNHYRNSQYLILSIVLLVALITWRAGWDYGLRVGASQITTPKTQPLSTSGEPKTNASTSSTEALDREPVASAAVRSNTSFAQVARDNPSTSSTEALDREPVASAAIRSNTSFAQVARDTPYPNELQGFKFYSKDLAPLHPGISERAAVVRLLGKGTRVVGGWRIIPTYITKTGSVAQACALSSPSDDSCGVRSRRYQVWGRLA